MNKGRWEAVHWRALVVPYSWVNCHIRSQVSGQERRGRDELTAVWIGYQFQVTHDKQVIKAAKKYM